MKYLIHQLINNVRNFVVRNNYVYLSKYSYPSIICIDARTSAVIWEHSFPDDQFYMSFYRKDIFVGDGESSTLLNHLNGDIILSSQHFEFRFRLYTNFSDWIIIQKQSSLLDVSTGVFDLSEDRVMFLRHDSFPFAIFDKIIIGKDTLGISRYDVHGDVEWRFELSSISFSSPMSMRNWEVSNFIGLVEEILWIDIASQVTGGALLGLNMNNGNVVHFLDVTTAINGSSDHDYMALFKNSLPTQLYSKYDENRKIIFGFNEYLHWEVDITKEKPKIYIRSLKSILSPLKATLPPIYGNCGITDEYIYASTGGLGDVLISQVYALNRETFEVDWRYTFDEPSRFFPVKADVSETHLFVLDNGGTLHIFEKEDHV